MMTWGANRVRYFLHLSIQIFKQGKKKPRNKRGL